MLFVVTSSCCLSSLSSCTITFSKNWTFNYIVYTMELDFSARSNGVVCRLLYMAILYVSCNMICAVAAANSSTATNSTSNTVTVLEKPDVIVLKSAACSRRGTFFTGVRDRYVCAGDSVVSEAVYRIQNSAARSNHGYCSCATVFNNQSDGNRTNTSSLNNFTYLAEFGSSLINATSFSPPCSISKYNLTYCACPHE